MALAETFDITNPAEFARPFALDMWRSPDMIESELTPVEDFKVTKINRDAGYIGLKGTYFVETGRSWIMQPYSITKNMGRRLMHIPGLTFQGQFHEYELVKIDGLDIEQKQHFRALCLRFHDALLLPYFDRLAGDNMVYTPALAVKSISRTR